MTIATTVVDQPEVGSFRAHLAAEAAAEEAARTGAVIEPPKPEPVKVEEPAIVEPEKVAEDEAASTKPDADLSEAGRLLRKNRADARKAKIQQEISEGIAERNRLRDEIATLRQHRTPASGGVKPDIATGTAFTFPSFEAWLAQPENAEKSYDEYGDARTDARYRFNERHTRAASERAAEAHAVQENVRAFHERSIPYREHFTDFDAVVTDLLLTPPMQTVAFANADGPAVVYHLAKTPTEYARIAALPAAEQLIELGQVRASIVAARSKPATKPVTQAPTPPGHTVGGAASASTIDTMRLGTSTKDHIRIEEAEIAESRRRGQG